ncbi:MAG: 2-dehydropantoate 2-reductase N-terminal domain-containing protein [Polyangiaceae bacterium]
MRHLIFGVGAVGGVLAARLLTLQTPDGDEHVRFPVYRTAAEAGLRSDDVILICTKTQDTASALEQLRRAGAERQPIVCLQNGVENERLALRLFPHVYGVCVMTPAVFLEPGIIRCYARPQPAILDVGRYPEGRDPVAESLAALFTRAGFASEADPAIMKQKYGKLLLNLGNAVQAVLGAHPRAGEFREAVRKEGEAVLRVAGIVPGDAGLSSPRRGDRMLAPVKGETHPGGSSWQSLARGAGTIETDYLNGEIVLLGRIHAVPTPVNECFARLAQELVRTGAPPGSVDPARIDRELGQGRAPMAAPSALN